MTKVSILMPVYNAGEFLRKSVQSVLEQTHKELELICVDDKSTDNSLEILKGFASKDNRLIIIEHSSNVGVGKRRDECLSLTHGEYLLFVDADD
jgi:glycosyltransferase involved in cell wall biosynthesis